MDIKAGPPVNSRVATTSQPSLNPASSSMSSDQKAPVVQSFDRWHEMPADITFQVMYWMMLNEWSKSAPAAFAMTSKCFYQAGQAFRRHHLHQSAQSNFLHRRLVNASRRYLDSLSYRPRVARIQNPADLISLLEYLSGDNVETGPMYYLQLATFPETIMSERCVHDAIRAHKGKSLFLACDADKFTSKLASYIAKTAPTSTSLYLDLYPRNADGKAITELLNGTCTHGHVTSITFLGMRDSTRHSEVRQALMDLLCGSGVVSAAIFEYLQTNDLLRDLTARFQEIRHLRLLSVKFCANITIADVEAFVAAVQQRHASGQPRITVAMCLPSSLKSCPDSIFSSKEKVLELEAIGLFLGKVEPGPWAQDLREKVRLSVGEGPIGTYIYHSRFVAASQAEVFEESDEIVEDSGE